MANSKRRCRECRKYSAFETGLIVNNSYYCDYNCITRYGIANKAKGERTKHREQKRNMNANDVALRKKQAQTAFNAFIRARDINKGCISCDKTKDWTGQWHAGHFKTTKARPDIRFNEDNCHKQCSICNNHLSGNIGEYTPKLIERIGKERHEALLVEVLIKRTAQDYKDIELQFKTKLNEV